MTVDVEPEPRVPRRGAQAPMPERASVPAFRPAVGSFRHEALFYADQSQFLEGTRDFIAEGLAGDEPMLVVLAAAKNDMLSKRLGKDAARVEFADMADVGANPARIIPAWRRFADTCEGDGRLFRGIGEPIWAGRSTDELVECQRHEALLNLAFADTSAFRLLCPYDAGALGPDVIEEAHRSHPSVVHGAELHPSDTYRHPDAVTVGFDCPLPEPTSVLAELVVEPGRLLTIRTTVMRHAVDAGLPRARIDDYVAAVNEIATNSLMHGGGQGWLRLWRQGPVVVCEVRDGGHIDDPMIGRVAPSEDQEDGRGLWLANQLCDLVQVRSFETGTVVRLHMSALA